MLAPSIFETGKPTLTPCNKTAGQSKKIAISAFLIILSLEHAVDSLRGRVFEVCLADLQNENHESAWRKI